MKQLFEDYFMSGRVDVNDCRTLAAGFRQGLTVLQKNVSVHEFIVKYLLGLRTHSLCNHSMHATRVILTPPFPPLASPISWAWLACVVPWARRSGCNLLVQSPYQGSFLSVSFFFLPRLYSSASCLVTACFCFIVSDIIVSSLTE